MEKDKKVEIKKYKLEKFSKQLKEDSKPPAREKNNNNAKH